MAGVVHFAKNRLSFATTSNRKLEKNISAEYTSLKHSIQSAKSGLEHSLKHINSKAHSVYAQSHVSFSERLANDVAIDSSLHETMKEASDAAVTVHSSAAKLITASSSNESSSAKMLSHVEAYLAELKTVIKEFDGVEKSFVETDRYQRKVEKLNVRKDKAEKKDKSNSKSKSDHHQLEKINDKTKRNSEKWEAERAAFQIKLDAVIEMMKKSLAKYEKMIQCVHAAFWLAEDQFLSETVNTYTTVIAKCKASEKELVDLDISKL